MRSLFLPVRALNQTCENRSEPDGWIGMSCGQWLADYLGHPSTPIYSFGRMFANPETGILPITVAVGTTITDRPPHGSVRARLRIRLLRRMSGVEACIGIGVQNAGRRNPPVQDWGKTFPTHLCALAAADQNTLP